MGLSVSILLLLYVANELSYNKFHENHKRIYRIISSVNFLEQGEMRVSSTLGTVGPELTSKYDEIINFCRIYSPNESLEKNGIVSLKELKIFYVDSSFFEIFTFPLIYGNKQTALTDRNSVAIGEQMAIDLFGNENPIGKDLRLNNHELKITSVFKELPANSDIVFDALISFKTFDPDNQRILRTAMDYETFLLFDNQLVKEGAEKRIISSIDEIVYRRFSDMEVSFKTELQPLEDIHLKSEFLLQIISDGKVFDIYFFIFSAVFILFLSIVNYINLQSTSLLNRAKEIGIRKSFGASSNQIKWQHLFESLLQVSISLVIAIAIVELVSLPFGKIVGRSFPLIYRESIAFNLLLIGATILLSIIVGVIPANFLSKLNPAEIFQKSGFKKGQKNIKVLSVLIQFSVTTFFIAFLTVMSMQVKFIYSTDLKFEKNDIVLIDHLPNTIKSKLERLAKEFEKSNYIEEFTVPDYFPGQTGSLTSIHIAGDSMENAKIIHEIPVDYNYLKTFNIEVIEGRDFNVDSVRDKEAILLNETAVQLLGGAEVNRDSFQVWRAKCKLIGIIRDYHFTSLYDTIAPLVLSLYRTRNAKIAIKTKNVEDYEGFLSQMTDKLKEIDPDFDPSYRNMEQNISNLYISETKNRSLFFSMSLIAIIISAIGLYTLISFLIIQRTKEIGIRKVLGEDFWGIIKIFLFDIGKWIIIAVIIAIPLVFILAEYWLGRFAYHIENYHLQVITTSFSILFFAAIIVVIKAREIASSNPVVSLRYE